MSITQSKTGRLKEVLLVFLLLSVGIFFPLIAEATLEFVVDFDSSDPQRPPPQEQIAVCETQARWEGANFITGSNCVTVSVESGTVDGETAFRALNGDLYRYVCPDPPSLNAATLEFVSENCYYSLIDPSSSDDVPDEEPLGLIGLVPTACSGSNGGADCPDGEGDYRPDGYGSCEFVELTNNVIQFLIKMTGVFAVIVFLYAGFIMVSSRGDAAVIGQSKKLFANALIGFVIMITAFLVINTILGVLVGGASGGLTWQKIECEYANASREAEEIDVGLKIQDGMIIDVMTTTEGTYSDRIMTIAGGGDPYVGGDCSPENLRSLGMTATQANTFSCIARPESACNLNAQNGWTSARGVFQMTRGWNDTCHNLNLPVCTAAAQDAGYSVSGNLNCSTAFSGGTSPSNPSRPTPGMEDLFNACNAAASNMACNTAAALCLYNDGGKYNHWLGNVGEMHHPAQRACVAKFDPANYSAAKYPF